MKSNQINSLYINSRNSGFLIHYEYSKCCCYLINFVALFTLKVQLTERTIYFSEEILRS